MKQLVVDESLVTGVRGFLYEVFSGIQGESLLVGERQIFVRFAGCNLHCAYCDTPGAHERTNICLAEQTPGKGDFEVAQNPMSTGEAIAYAERLETTPGLHHSVSLTGGEPLSQSRFAMIVARELKAKGFRIFLETNGELPERLPEVLPFVDIVSMDIKLPSSTGCPDMMPKHELFLRTASEKEVHTKIVVTSKTLVEEVLAAAKMIRSVDAGIPLILQPVTAHNNIVPPTPLEMLELQAKCKGILVNVRVIPQCHKMMNQR